MPTRPVRTPRSGSVLVAVLVIVTLLTLAAYQYSEMMTAEYRAASSSLKAQQAKALAESGVAYAAAVLADPDTFAGTLSGNPFDNAGAFGGIEVQADERSGVSGKFYIVSPADVESGSTGQGFRYGVVDESGKINVNALIKIDSSGETAVEILTKIPGLSEEVADAILDWIDGDDEQRAAGAESSYYMGLSPPYRAKNGPLDSLEELLLVKGVTPELLFGSDRNRNGVEDPGEADTGWSPGWAAYLTVYSRERNVDAEGNPRIFLNDTDLKAQHDKLAAVDPSLADFIALYRTQTQSAGSSGGGTTATMTMTVGGPGGSGGVMVVQMTTSGGGAGGNSRPATADEIAAKVNEVIGGAGQQQQPRSLSSRFELIGASVSWTVGSGRNQTTVTMASPLNDKAQLPVVLPLLLDKTTTQNIPELPGRVNVLTAAPEALACLPGLTETDVEQILEARPSFADGEATDPAFQTTAWLVTDANISTDKMRALERYITSRTQVYRFQVLGQFDRGGPFARVEAVVDTNAGKPRIVMYRDLTTLGRGYDPTTK